MIQNSFLLAKNSFQISASLYSKENTNNSSPSLETETTSSSDNSISTQLRERSERMLQEDQMRESRVEQNTNTNSMDSFEIFTANTEESTSVSDWDAYTWLRAENLGQMIDPNHPIRFFAAIRLLHLFLEHEFRIHPHFLTPVLLTRISNMFLSNPDITVHQYLNQVRTLIEQDPNFISNQLQSESENLTDSTDSVEVARSLGELGDLTLNQLVNNLRNLTWPDSLEIIERISIQPGELLANTVSYSLTVRGYITFVHNRPFAPGISPEEVNLQRRIIRLQLRTFVFIGAPLIMYSLRYAAISMRDVAQIEWRPNEPNSNSTDNSGNNNTKNSGLILVMVTKFMQKKPDWLKFLALIIIVIILSLKIGGLLNFWLVYSIIGLTFAISFQLFYLFLIYLVDKKKTNVPFILPNFIKKWLKKELEILSKSSKEGIQYLKNEFYLHLYMYLGILILALLIFF